MNSQSVLLLSVAIWLCALSGVADGQSLIWVEFAQSASPGEGRVQFACPERSVAQGLRTPWDVAFNPIAGTVYWSDVIVSKLYRANLDGSGIIVHNLPNFARGVKLDVANGTVYWSTTNNTREIRKSNLDFSNSEQVINISAHGHEQVNWIDLDLVNGKIYYTDDQTNKIYRANLDGTNIEECLANHDGLADIAVDPESGKVYWAEAGTEGVFGDENIFIGDLTCPITNIWPLVPGTGEAFTGLELDVAAGKIYWTEYSNRVIRRANLVDGSEQDTVWSTSSNPVGITLAAGPSCCDSDDECGECELCDIQTNTCFTAGVPDCLIEALVGLVLELNLQNGIENSLDSKLDAVQSALNDLNQNNDAAACNSIAAFISAVDAQRGNKISEDDADTLIAAAEEILGALGCP